MIHLKVIAYTNTYTHIIIYMCVNDHHGDDMI